MHCLAGENGAGKSTLIKILTGADPARQRHLRDRGPRRRQPVARSQARDAGIGVVYQELSLLPDLSVGENLLMGRLPARRGITRPGELRKPARDDARARRARVAGPAARRSTETSLAARQLVEIAKVLGANPRVLIFDEPTTALSESETKALLARIHQLRDEGHAIMYVSHHLEEMFEIGDRVTVLRDGKFAECQPMGEFDHDWLIASMVGRKIEKLYPHGEARRSASRGCTLVGLRPAGARDADRPRGPRPARSSASRACSAPAAPSCCARSSAPTRSTAATSRSTASGCRAAARAGRCRPASGC